MNGIDKDVLLEYAELKAKIKEMEARVSEIAPSILEVMTSTGSKQIEVKGTGKFTLSPCRTWTYPEELVTIETDLEAKKKGAKQKGTATYVEKPVLKFTIEKPNVEEAN